MNIKIGDFVKGITNDYGITNTKMTRGVVINVYERNIEVRVLDHDDGETGVYTVDPKKFEVIGHQKQFDRAEVLKLLKDGCKKAILDYDLRGADLSNANLRGANLSNADLRGADLSNANLRGADLSDASLRGANLRGADLSNANLRGAGLSEADLSNANLRGADLRGANLRGADLRGADLSNANLRGAGLSEADLSNANLRGADLRGANLRGADLRGADLRGADLSNANLRGADLRGADLRGADLRGANLRGADLRGADLDYSCYPLWCGSLHFKADKRLACQLAYHLCSMQCDDADYIKMRNSILGFANQFHRVDECGELKEREI